MLACDNDHQQDKNSTNERKKTLIENRKLQIEMLNWNTENISARCCSDNRCFFSTPNIFAFAVINLL